MLLAPVQTPPSQIQPTPPSPPKPGSESVALAQLTWTIGITDNVVLYSTPASKQTYKSFDDAVHAAHALAKTRVFYRPNWGEVTPAMGIFQAKDGYRVNNLVSTTGYPVSVDGRAVEGQFRGQLRQVGLQSWSGLRALVGGTQVLDLGAGKYGEFERKQLPYGYDPNWKLARP